MAISFKGFRTRSAQRDESTDLSRRTSVKDALDSAIHQIVGEIAGLEARISTEMDRSAFAMTASADYGEREDEDEKLLEEIDHQISNAQQRVSNLKAQHKVYALMIQNLNEISLKN